MPDFWQYPTVSMGLGPLTAAYQARYMRYLEYRELKPHQGERCGRFSATARWISRNRWRRLRWAGEKTR